MDISAPLSLYAERVRPDWIDYNGHMNVAYYVLVFDHATDEFFDYLGLTEEQRHSADVSTFAAEIHVTYQREVGEGDELRVTTQLINHDEKRIHFFHRMYGAAGGQLAATFESLSLAIDLTTRRVGVFPKSVRRRLAAVQQVHSGLAKPDELGAVIGMARRRPRSSE